MIPIATKVCLFSDKTNFHWKIIRPVEVDLFGAWLVQNLSSLRQTILLQSQRCIQSIHIEYDRSGIEAGA